MENLNVNPEIASTVINSEIKREKLQQKKDAKKAVTNVPKKGAQSEKKVLTATSKQGEKLINLNLSKYKSVLDKFSGKEVVAKDNMYIYPEGFTELDKVSKRGKQFRQNRRNAIFSMFSNVQLFAKHNRNADVIAEVEKFKKFYKDNYLVNDFSVASVTRTQTDVKAQFIRESLEIIKDIISQTTKTGKKK